jgi:hypothetical protein
MTLVEKPADQVMKEDIACQVLEAAARKLENTHANKLYRSAWRAAAKMIRELKPR